MVNKQISINFCGGCNPRINRLELAQEVERLLFENGIMVIFNSFEADLIIYLSGCSSNCAQRNSGSNIPCIVVAAATIDAVAVDENKIIAEIVTRVRRFYKRMEIPKG